MARSDFSGLHWISMFLWLISPRNVFHGERISKFRKAIIAGLISFVYVFAYVNLQEVNHRRKMVTFYIVMFMENCLLVSVWLVGIWADRPEQWYLIPILVIGTFVIGVAFMLLYYRFFHVRRLGYEAGGRPPSVEVTHCCTDPSNCGDICKCTRIMKSNKMDYEHATNNEQHVHNVPGVFNCRFSNPVANGTKRKKKKPTSFVPPPSAMGRISPISGPEAIPFWRKPLPAQSHNHQGGSSENEGSSVGSRVNIYQKLQEKKQKQLAELKIIEEEIRQGKLGGPNNKSVISEDDSSSPLPRQPIPVSKKHNDIQPIVWAPHNPEMEKDFENLSTHLSGYPNQSSYNLMNTNILYNAPMYSQDMNEYRSQNHQDNGNASPVSQISATESNSLTQKTLPHLHSPNEMIYSYDDNTPEYASGSVGMNYNMFSQNFQENKKSQSPLSVQSHSPKPTEFSRNICERRRGNLSYDGNSYESNDRKGNCFGNQDSFPYNMVPPPKTKLERLERSGLDKHKAQRSQTPEILLSPHYLNNSSYLQYCQREPNYRLLFDNSLVTVNENGQMPISKQECNGSKHDRNFNEEDDFEMDNVHSDIDSQISLPRSYTLPREFKYYKRNRGKRIRNEHIVMSTNSSDGDVDSGDDDNESLERANHSFNNSKLHNVQLNKQRKLNGHFVPVPEHHHLLKYNQDVNAIYVCHPSTEDSNYDSPNLLSPVRSGSIGRRNENINTPLSNIPLVNGLSSPSNLLNSELSINMRPLRSRHCCNGARHETKL